VMCRVDRSDGRLGGVQNETGGQSTIWTEKGRHAAKHLTRDRDVRRVGSRAGEVEARIFRPIHSLSPQASPD
jgi:hypothetical protein